MRSIVAWCLKNKSVVILATVLLIASGAYATTQLNQELLPDIEFPAVGVATPVPGAGPDLVDEQVTQPIESAVGNIGGIESTQSTSSQGFSIVLIEFSLDTDIDEAEDEIRRALDGVSLPSQAAEPEINRQSASSFPILNISLSTENGGDLSELTSYAQDDVVPLLEEVEGTSGVDLVGGAEQEIQVNLDTGALEERGLPADAVVGAISAADVNAPVGDVRINGLSTPVRAESQLNDVEALRQLPLGVAGAAGGAPSGGAPPEGGSEGSSGGAPPAGASGAPPTGAPPSGAPASGGESSEPVLLQDVAEVEQVQSNISGISRTNGEPSLGLNITKDGDANTVEVSDGVRDALGEVRDEIGDEQVNIIFDSAGDVEDSVSGLVEKALIGAVVAVLIILLFLGSIRATLVTAVSLPTSVLAALLFSWGNDLTLNIITLAGLTIAVGRVVDDAIVVLENAYRYVQEGDEPEEAALKGTTEVASAITSSTLSTIAVFLPLGLVGGIVSEFFLPLSLTVAFALAASLVVAVTIIPVLVSVFIKRVPQRSEKSGGSSRRRTNRGSSSGGGGGRKWVLRMLIGVAALVLASIAAAAIAVLADALDPETLLDSTALLITAAVLAAVSAIGLIVFLFLPAPGGSSDGADSETDDTSGANPDEEQEPGEGEGRLVGIYTPALRWSLRNRAVVLVLALFFFAGGLAAIPFLAVSFFPPSEARLLVADITFPSGTTLEETSDEVEPFEDAMLDDSGVDDYQLSIGGEDNFDPSGNRSDNTAQAFVTVGEDASVDDTVDRLEEEGRDLYGRGDFQVEVQDQGPPAGGLEVTVTNGSEEELRNASETIVDELSGNDDLTSVQSDISGGAPEVNAELNDEEAAAAGLAPASVAQTLGVLLSDRSELSLGDTPVSVGVPQGSVDSLDQVRGLPVGAGTTLGDIAEVQEVDAPAAISRADGDQAVTVTGTITSQDSNAVSSEVSSTLEDLDLPGEVEASVGGESEDIAESFRNLLLSIVVAIALVYLILVIFFRSLLIPLVILLAIPLTSVGAFGALLLTGTALSVPALLGVLLLIGIVVANAILLIDFVINAENEHESLDEAIVEAGRARLRPILMTALVTIGALTPLALGIGGGSTLISSSLAIPVIGGLTTSTFLTLLVVPVGYSVLEGARNRLGVKKS